MRDVEGRSVHVWRGRHNHIAKTFGLTYCGRAWTGVNVGPPATDRPICSRCEAKRALDFDEPERSA